MRVVLWTEVAWVNTVKMGGNLGMKNLYINILKQQNKYLPNHLKPVKRHSSKTFGQQPIH